jgi:hypothetical protein
MAVNLSSLAGAGAQFFDNNGAPLSGGLIYTYLAGTTTPAVTYTSSLGVTPHSNPIVLDAAGRIATGEIWLTSSTDYKFVTKTSVGVQLGSYDNIPSINDFTSVYTGLANTSNPALGDALVGFRQSNASGNLANAIGRTVHTKLQESVSVKDFGAVGDGSNDDTSAFISAIASVTASGARLYVPEGTYLITATLTIGGFVNIYGDGILNTLIKASGNFSSVFTFSSSAYYCFFSNLSIRSDSTTTQCVNIQQTAVVIRFYNVEFYGDLSGDLVYSNGDNVEFESCSWYLAARATNAANLDCFNQNTGFLNCRIGGLGTGIIISNNFAPASRVEGTRIDNCYFINTGPYNILLGNSLLTAISNCVLDQATDTSLYLSAGATNVLVNNSWLGLRYLLDGNASITQAASVASVTMPQPHYLATGQLISVSGADQSAYNIQAVVTVTGTNTFTYPITGSPASPATGTIVIRRPGQSFFATAGCYGVTLANNVIHGGTNGVIFQDTAATRTSKVIINGNQFNQAYSASLGLGSVEDCVVTSNVELSTPTSSWYTTGVNPSYGNYLFSNNHWQNPAPAYYDTNSTYRFGNDTGIVGKNRGANLAVGAVTVLVISHGLFTTPTSVVVTPSLALTNYYVSAITSTNFTVTWTGAATPVIYWSAEV